MNTFISDFPKDWLIQCVAAQGHAISYFLRQAPERDSNADLANKSVLYFGWLLNRSGLFTIDDALSTIKEMASADNAGLPEILHSAIRHALQEAYAALDVVYKTESDEKQLVSDSVGKPTLQ
jgi:hypothetical protein